MKYFVRAVVFLYMFLALPNAKAGSPDPLFQDDVEASISEFQQARNTFYDMAVLCCSLSLHC